MRHSLPRRPPVLPIVIGIVLAVVAGVGAVRAVWVSSTSSDAPAAQRGEQRADRSAPRGDMRCAGVPVSAPRELRGIWITTVENIDWPSRPGLPDEQIKSEYLGWLDLAGQRNLNAVFVHVRPSGDAL